MAYSIKNLAPTQACPAPEHGDNKPEPFSHRLGRVFIGLSVAPIPLVAPLLRLVTRPVAGALQQSTNREVSDQIEATDDIGGRELAIQRAIALEERGQAQIERLNAEPNLKEQLAFYTNCVMVPVFAVMASLPTLSTLPILPYIPIPGVLPAAVAVAAVGVGCAWGLDRFNAWRDRADALNTQWQSEYFSNYGNLVSDARTIAKLKTKVKQLEAGNSPTTEHQCQQATAQR